jgi:hypothetical protein
MQGAEACPGWPEAGLQGGRSGSQSGAAAAGCWSSAGWAVAAGSISASGAPKAPSGHQRRIVWGVLRDRQSGVA